MRTLMLLLHYIKIALCKYEYFDNNLQNSWKIIMKAVANWPLLFALLVLRAVQQSTDSFTAYFTSSDASAMDIHYSSSTVVLANSAYQILQYPAAVLTNSSIASNTIPTSHKARISTLALSPNNQIVLSGGSDFTVRFYNIASKAQLCMFDELRGDIISGRIGSDNDMFAFGSNQGYLYYGSISSCTKTTYIKLDYVFEDVEVITSRNEIWVVDGVTSVIVINYLTNSTNSYSLPTGSLLSVYHMASASSIAICSERAFYIVDYSGNVKLTQLSPSFYTYKCRVASDLLTGLPNIYYLTAVSQVPYFNTYSPSATRYSLWNIWKVDAVALKATLFHEQLNTASRYGATGTIVDDAGVFLVSASRIQVTSIANGFVPLYNYYRDTGTVSCSSTFQQVGLSCEKCNWDETIKSYCNSCNPSSGNCLSCLPNTFYQTSAKTCGACPANCYLCTDAVTCTTCMGNYTLVGSNCILNNLTGCVVSYWYSSTVSKCYQCEVGFMPENNLACKNCQEVWPNCSECDASQCYKCKPNFVMNAASTNCQACSYAIEGCAACLNQTYCDTCYESYPYFSLPAVGYRICQPMCQFPCLTCVRTNIGSCLSCDTNRTLVGSTCVCQPQFQIYNSTTQLCEICSDFMSNCLNCTNETFCTQCDTGVYFDDLTVGSQTCKTCNYTCASCNTKWYECQSCDPGMFRSLNSATKLCQCQSISYFEMGSNPVCQLCSDYITNCNVCYNQTYCVTCDSGYYVKNNGTGSTICGLCTPPCLQCFSNPTNCTDCAAGRVLNYSTRTCDCLQGFYATSAVACAPCSPLLGSCLQCNNGTICLLCWTNNYFVMVGGLKKCDLCQITCLTCSVTIDVCATCDPLANRVLNTVTKQCDCMVGYTETNGRCLNCTATFDHCTACDATTCYSCEPGFSLAYGGLKCVDCQSTYPGCTNCLNGVCAACNESSGYELAYSKCICKPGYYFKQLECLSYAMGPYVQRLFPAYTMYNQDMNTSIIQITIYFQCEGIKLPYGLQNSLRIWIDEQEILSYEVRQKNTTFTFKLTPADSSSKSVIKIEFNNSTVFDLDEYGPAQRVFIFNSNVYFDDKYDLSTAWSTIFTTNIIPVVRWATSILVLLGCADYVIMLVFTVHLLPAFVFLNVNAPLALLSTLKSMVQINGQSLFIFANIDVGYQGYASYTSLINVYGLAGGVVNRKIMDLVFMGCVLAFYGILCPRLTSYIPEGRLKKLWQLKFHLKRYSTFSNTLLLFLPSFLFCCINDLRVQAFNPSSYVTISISLLLLAFSCVFLFVHCTLLHNTQFNDSFKNEDCYFGSSILQPKSTSYICSMLCIGIIFIQLLGLLPGIYCLPIMVVVVLWYISHFKNWDNFPNKILYFVKLFYGLFVLFFCISYLVFEISQKYLTVEIKTVELLGLVSLACILILFSLAVIETIFLMVYTVYKHCRHSINLVDNIEDQKDKAEAHEESYDGGTVYNMKVTLAEREKEDDMFTAKLTNKQEHMKKFRQMQLRTASTKMYQSQTQQGFRATGMSTGSKKKF